MGFERIPLSTLPDSAEAAPRTHPEDRHPPTSRPKPLSLPNMITLVTVAFLGSLALSGWVAGVPPPPPGATVSAGCTPANVPASASGGEYLNLSIFTDASQGREFLVPANFSVPAGVVIHISVTNYDPASSPAGPFVQEVCGTLTDIATVDGSPVHSFGETEVSHTFTVDLGAAGLLNVPIPPRTGPEPVTISFSTYFPSEGTFGWHSQTDVGEINPTGVPDGMSGYVTVL